MKLPDIAVIAACCAYLILSPAVSAEVISDLTDVCLHCMCTLSPCKTPDSLPGSCDAECGLFNITKAQWTTAGLPTVSGTAAADTEDNSKEFIECAYNFECAAKALRGFVARHYRDCNYDDIVDCEDFHRIKHLGGDECPYPKEESYFQSFSKLLECLADEYRKDFQDAGN